MENDMHFLLDDQQKTFLSEELGIIIDSDLFDPRYDYVFKRIFTAGGEVSKLALIDFLNAALQFTGDQKIVNLTVVNAEIPVSEKAQKKSVFDIRVIFNDDEQALVEMELRPKDDFKKRSQFLISKAYSQQRIAGSQYRDLKKCYLICITNFTLFRDNTAYYRDFMYRDTKGEPLTDDLTIVFLELSKLDVSLRKPVEALNGIEMWGIFLRYASDNTKRDLLNQILNKKEGIKMAAQVLEIMSKDEKERMLYESQLLYEADLEAAWRYRERRVIEKGFKQGVEKGIEQGIEKGIEQGIEKGIEQGIEKGIEKGIEQGIEKGIEKGILLVAKNLKSQNIAMEIIAASTGIAYDVLEKL